MRIEGARGEREEDGYLPFGDVQWAGEHDAIYGMKLGEKEIGSKCKISELEEDWRLQTKVEYGDIEMEYQKKV